MFVYYYSVNDQWTSACWEKLPVCALSCIHEVIFTQRDRYYVCAIEAIELVGHYWTTSSMNARTGVYFLFSENRSTVGYNVLCDIFLVLVEISLLFSSMQNCPTVCFSFQYFHLEFVQGIRVFHERKSRLDQLTGWGLRHHTVKFI